MAENVAVRFEMTDEGVASLEMVREGDGRGTVETDLELWVPRKTPLTMTNSRGAIRVSNLHAPLVLATSYDSIEVTDVEGRVTVDGRHGSIRIEGVVGEVEARNRFGDLTVKDVTGDLLGETTSGTITVEQVAGTVRLSNRSSRIRVSRDQRKRYHRGFPYRRDGRTSGGRRRHPDELSSSLRKRCRGPRDRRGS